MALMQPADRTMNNLHYIVRETRSAKGNPSYCTQASAEKLAGSQWPLGAIRVCCVIEVDKRAWLSGPRTAKRPS